MKITKLFSNENKQSDFTETSLSTLLENYLVLQPKLVSFEKGFKIDWHNAPGNLLIYYIKGSQVVTLRNGNQKVFKPGDIVWACDQTGSGHRSANLNNSGEVHVLVAELSEATLVSKDKNVS